MNRCNIQLATRARARADGERFSLAACVVARAVHKRRILYKFVCARVCTVTAGITERRGGKFVRILRVAAVQAAAHASEAHVTCPEERLLGFHLTEVITEETSEAQHPLLARVNRGQVPGASPFLQKVKYAPSLVANRNGLR